MSVIEPSALPPISKGQLRSARALLRRKSRLERGEFIAEGPQAVREAIRAGAAKLIVLDQASGQFDDVLIDPSVPTVQGSADQLRELSESVTPQGIVAICATPRATLDRLAREPKLVAICAQIRDPGNLGTVIRCADAFGADAVIVTEESVEFTNPKTVRASVGSIFHLPVVTAVSFDDALTWCADRGLTTRATQMTGRPLPQLDLAQPTAWVFGNEAWGLPTPQAQACDEVVSIPMWGQAESLNLSTAAAVCLYSSAVAQRGLAG